jgi:AraC-like DNA-binding protein
VTAPFLKSRPKPFIVRGDAASWAEGLSSVFVELEVEQADPTQSLIGRLYRYPFGDLTFVRAMARGGAHRVVRSERLIKSSTHNNFFIGYLLSGTARLSQGGRWADLNPGDIAILDSTREYSIDVPASLDALWISTPRYRLEGRLPALAEIMAQKIDGHAGVGYVASAILRSALAEASRLLPHEANRIANSLLDLLGIALANGRGGLESVSSSHRASALRRVQEFIESRLDDEELDLPTIAKKQHLSVRYLNKLFEREGISIARWIRMRRLERCRIDLEDINNRGRQIGEIAYSHGFGNVSHFNRQFKSHFGCSPKAFRQRN